ncbi:MAG: hypothetical protein A2W00_04700 [Candidatus Eisenbacteria bacterium RBG_16_71_46]|nr:MAG: hypothetical protein A2W00_04700 [Candidatus Eisenbacteria bacterium RBG_16_71_46]
MHNLSKNCKTVRLPLDGTSTYTGTAGTSDLTSEGLDTLGYAGVRFLIGFGAITSGAVTSVKAQQSTDDAATDAYSDIEGSGITVADDDDNQVAIIDIYHPQKRYLDVVIDRGTQNAVVDFILAELYLPADAPITQDTTVISAECHSAPAEGTA